MESYKFLMKLDEPKRTNVLELGGVNNSTNIWSNYDLINGTKQVPLTRAFRL